MAQKRRIYQIAEKIRNAVAMELLHAADPRFHMVTITSVVASSDLRQAKIYWVVSGEAERRGEVEKAFTSAAGMLKRVVGKDLGIKFIPDLKFFYDDTLDTTAQVERIFHEIQQQDALKGQK